MSHPEPSPEPEPEPGSISDDLLELQSLPGEVGVLLLVIGAGGVLLPGPVGTPFLIMGGVVLWPALFSKVESAFERRFPKAHRLGMRQLHRFIHDLESRYPTAR